MYQRPLSIAILALCGSAAVPHALALGFGRIPESLAYGQAIDLSVPLRLDPGESLSPACLSAEINLGERRLPKAAVRLQLEGMGQGAQAARVRIRSDVVVQEPVLAVSLSVGCSGAVSRRFMVFADPPVTGVDATPSVVAELPRAVVGATPRFRSQDTPTRPAVATSTGAKGDTNPTGATRAVAAQDSAIANTVPVTRAVQEVSAAEQRVVALERNLQDMRVDATAHRAAMDQMRSRLGQADEWNQKVWMLLAVAIGLAAVALLQGLRLRNLQRERPAGRWQGAVAASEVETLPSHAAVVGLPLVDLSIRAGAGTPRAEPMDAMTPAQSSQVVVRREGLLPPGAIAEATLTRAPSVDELIDLEQQAEFFLVLGEEDAAIDLLMAHLRSSGGVSPLPYLKLLAIYRRRQDRESFDRMRKRFERRFNAVAPDWDADPERGRALQDHPAVLAALQKAWQSPPEAMAELENLLLHKRGGEFFELPAYRDVLTLFAVARDLHRQVDDHPAAGVDLLLPLHLGRDLEPAPVPSIFDRLERSSRVAGVIVADRPKAPIDLDLSDRPGALRSGTMASVVVPLRPGRR